MKSSSVYLDSITIERILQIEITESKKWFDIDSDDNTYKRDLEKRIELIKWVLENMKNAHVQICNVIESKMDEIILTINKNFSIFGADKLDSELRILDWKFYHVCINEIKRL
jgi:hypothetical protein